ncbi:hypothetical protein SKAU_G00184290 [Synaphobranchus kaupii]|uniref:Uncharacterized protein n=1 Tax=Synaphobranchus kaupii TaxID=118154 RepID=A0A9Q1FC69_SYNKA|nr:hypothetical protein SKAU_G00184290 [Synaphobranchus kaupii]
MSFGIQQDFDANLSDTSSPQYRELEMVIRNAVDKAYTTNLDGYLGVSDIRFSNGSVVSKYTIRTNTVSSPDIRMANQAVAITLEEQTYIVVPNSFTAALTEDTFPDLDLVFTGQSMFLRCQPKIEGPVTWTVKGEDVIKKPKFDINNEDSSLTVRKLLTSDSGTYECFVKNGIVEFNRRQKITVLPTPTVFLEDEIINSHCNTIVKVKCCAEPRDFPLVWTEKQSGRKLETNVKSIENNFICITHNYDGKCQQEILLICTLSIKNINYTKEATLHFFNAGVIFPCNDSIYGFGKENEIKSIGCPGGSKVSKCEDGEWKFVSSTCLLPEIKELQIESEVLDPERIEGFLERLLNITDTTKAEVVISTTNILTVVEILNNVVNVIDGPVNSTLLENFLETVDILISLTTEGTWDLLNENSSTTNTSSDLLNSVEEIVEAIGDTSIDITTSTIQLNKTIFSENFSADLNSTVQINVSDSTPRFETEITTVNFRTMHIVLPPQNLTSLNNTINGAVVLVHTNSTNTAISNITLTFTIRNTTLANPQCVFWNFTLLGETEGGWDSSGCEVQTDGDESVTCFCNHLTSFSILMSPFIPEAIRIILDFITYIGVGISLGSLVLCLIIEAIVWTAVTRNNISYMRHVTIVNIAVSLLIANIWFIIGAAISDIDQETPVGPCSAATFFIHFFYLALFFWMLISGLLLFYHMVMVFSAMSKRKMMAIAFTVGYGAPLIIAVITVAVTAPQDGYFRRDDACWLNWFETKALLAFVIPALAIVFINFIILIVVLYKLLRRGVGENQTDDRNALVVMARCVALLTPFFGLTWGFGIGVMLAPQSIGLHVVFAVLNSLQGFFVLVFGTLLDSRMRAALAGRFSFITSSNRTRTTSGGPSSSSGLGLFLRRRRGIYHVSEAVSSSQSNAASESFVST